MKLLLSICPYWRIFMQIKPKLEANDFLVSRFFNCVAILLKCMEVITKTNEKKKNHQLFKITNLTTSHHCGCSRHWGTRSVAAPLILKERRLNQSKLGVSFQTERGWESRKKEIIFICKLVGIDRLDDGGCNWISAKRIRICGSCSCFLLLSQFLDGFSSGRCAQKVISFFIF